MLVIQPIAPAFVLPAARLRNLTLSLLSSRTERLLFSKPLLFSAYFFCCISQIFYRIASNQPIRFLCFQSDAVDDVAITSQSSFSVAPATSLVPGDTSVAATAAVSTATRLTTEHLPRAVAGMLSAQSTVSSPTQAVLLPVKAAL